MITIIKQLRGNSTSLLKIYVTTSKVLRNLNVPSQGVSKWFIFFIIVEVHKKILKVIKKKKKILWNKVYPLQVTVPPMGGNGRLLR